MYRRSGYWALFDAIIALLSHIPFVKMQQPNQLLKCAREFARTFPQPIRHGFVRSRSTDVVFQSDMGESLGQ